MTFISSIILSGHVPERKHTQSGDEREERALPDDQGPLAPSLLLDRQEPWVLHDGVLLDGQDAGVAVPDPGHGVGADLTDPAGQVHRLAHVGRQVCHGLRGEGI